MALKLFDHSVHPTFAQDEVKPFKRALSVFFKYFFLKDTFFTFFFLSGKLWPSVHTYKRRTKKRSENGSSKIAARGWNFWKRGFVVFIQHSNANKTNFHMKSFALSLSFITRFTKRNALKIGVSVFLFWAFHNPTHIFRWCTRKTTEE